MKLTICSSTQTHEYDISYLEVETSVGNFVILDGHEPLLLLVKPKSDLIFSRITSAASHEKQPLSYGGILKITRSSATLIINE